MLQFRNNPVHVQVEHKRNDAGPWLWAWRIAVLLALLALIAVMAAKADAEPRQPKPKPKPQPVAYTLIASGRALEANRAAAALAAPQLRSEGTLSFDSSGYVYVDCPGCTGVTGFADNSAFTVGTTPVTVLAGYYTTGSAPTLSSGDAGRVRIDSNSYLYIDCAVGCSGGGAGGGSNFGSAFPSAGAAFGATNGTNLEPLQVNGSGYLETLLENASVAVTGTFWQSTQPVSGTFWQSIQPVSWTGQSVSLTGAWPYSGTLGAVMGSGVFEVGPTTAANTASNQFFTQIVDGTRSAVVTAGSVSPASASAGLTVDESPNTKGCGGQSLANTASAAINASSSGENQLIAASSGKTIYVCQVTFLASAAVTVEFTQATSGTCGGTVTAITGPMAAAANGGIAPGNGQGVLFAAGSGDQLCLNLGGAQQVSGWVTYAQVAAP